MSTLQIPFLCCLIHIVINCAITGMAISFGLVFLCLYYMSMALLLFNVVLFLDGGRRWDDDKGYCWTTLSLATKNAIHRLEKKDCKPSEIKGQFLLELLEHSYFKHKFFCKSSDSKLNKLFDVLNELTIANKQLSEKEAKFFGHFTYEKNKKMLKINEEAYKYKENKKYQKSPNSIAIFVNKMVGDIDKKRSENLENIHIPKDILALIISDFGSSVVDCTDYLNEKYCRYIIETCQILSCKYKKDCRIVTFYDEVKKPTKLMVGTKEYPNLSFISAVFEYLSSPCHRDRLDILCTIKKTLRKANHIALLEMLKLRIQLGNLYKGCNDIHRIDVIKIIFDEIDKVFLNNVANNLTMIVKFLSESQLLVVACQKNRWGDVRFIGDRLYEYYSNADKSLREAIRCIIFSQHFHHDNQDFTVFTYINDKRNYLWSSKHDCRFIPLFQSIQEEQPAQ